MHGSSSGCEGFKETFGPGAREWETRERSCCASGCSIYLGVLFIGELNTCHRVLRFEGPAILSWLPPTGSLHIRRRPRTLHKEHARLKRSRATYSGPGPHLQSANGARTSVIPPKSHLRCDEGVARATGRNSRHFSMADSVRATPSMPKYAFGLFFARGR